MTSIGGGPWTWVTHAESATKAAVVAMTEERIWRSIRFMTELAPPPALVELDFPDLL
jgi:hypothetical protein